MKVQLGPSSIIFPVPAALIACGTMENPNIVTVAWIGMANSEPPVVAISLKNSRYSLELIRETKDFTVNIPSAEYFKETDYCGIISGRERDKFADTGFTAIESKKVGAPIIKECPFNMECRVVKEETEFGKWVVVFGEIIEAHIDEDKIDVASNKIDVGKVDPLVYCATIREYWRLAEKLGDGFKVGKEILQRVKGK